MEILVTSATGTVGRYVVEQLLQAAAGADGYSQDDYSELLRPWPDVQQGSGQPVRSFAEWARDHVEDFR